MISSLILLIFTNFSTLYDSTAFWYEKHISINHIIVIMKTEDYKAQAAAAAEVSAQAAKDAAKAEMNNLKQQGEEAKAAADSKVNDLKNQAANLKRPSRRQDCRP